MVGTITNPNLVCTDNTWGNENIVCQKSWSLHQIFTWPINAVRLDIFYLLEYWIPAAPAQSPKKTSVYLVQINQLSLWFHRVNTRRWTRWPTWMWLAAISRALVPLTFLSFPEIYLEYWCASKKRPCLGKPWKLFWLKIPGSYNFCF